MNLFQLVIRYGSVLAKYGNYLKYLPFVYNFIIFIRQAQARYTEAGSGGERLKWATAEFVRLVDSAEQYGIIQSKLADSLRDVAEKLMTAVVEAMKEAGGVPPLADPNAVLEIVPLMGDVNAQPTTPATPTTAGASSTTPGVQTA